MYQPVCKKKKKPHLQRKHSCSSLPPNHHLPLRSLYPKPSFIPQDHTTLANTTEPLLPNVRKQIITPKPPTLRRAPTLLVRRLRARRRRLRRRGTTPPSKIVILRNRRRAPPRTLRLRVVPRHRTRRNCSSLRGGRRRRSSGSRRRPCIRATPCIHVGET